MARDTGSNGNTGNSGGYGEYRILGIMGIRGIAGDTGIAGIRGIAGERSVVAKRFSRRHPGIVINQFCDATQFALKLTRQDLCHSPYMRTIRN